MRWPDRQARRGLWVAAAALMAAVAAGGAARVVVHAPRDSRSAAPADAPSHARLAPILATTEVVAHGADDSVAYEGVVEALHETVLAAQVAGSVVALPVQAGDKVRAGQILMRIDARAAEQSAAAGAAQARAAAAAVDEATRDFERQRQLFAQGFISQAALDRAEAHFRTAQAEASAQLANARAARTQSDLHVVVAPYAGVVAKVSVVLGDMALPGRPLLTMYDPSALRVTAAIPLSAATSWNSTIGPRAQIPAAAPDLIQPTRAQWLPMVDAASDTVELRLELPPDTRAAPGMFARAWLPRAAERGVADAPRLFVPSQALVRRSDVVAVYVIGADGKPQLRQVRPGHAASGEVEILSGVAMGERIALDPQAAARAR